jgi:hypothetical protein
MGASSTRKWQNWTCPGPLLPDPPQQVPHRGNVPASAARCADSTPVQHGRYRPEPTHARGADIDDDRQDIRREPVSF